jgi:hypothetical protein
MHWVDNDGAARTELWPDFVDHLIEGYVGLPDTKLYGEDAIVELARNWLAKTDKCAA